MWLLLWLCSAFSYRASGYRGGREQSPLRVPRSILIQLIEAFDAETLQELIANFQDRHAAKACLGEFLLARRGADIHQAEANLLLLEILLGCLAVRAVGHAEE